MPARIAQAADRGERNRAMHIRNPIEWAVAQLEAPSIIGSTPPEDYWPATRRAGAPEIQQISLADLREAVRRGLHDFAAGRTDVMVVCLVYPAIALFIAIAEAHGGFLPLLGPTAAGFVLVGPFLAVGLYEMSRQREMTGKLNWLDVFNVVRSPSIGAIAGLGLLLIVLFLVWLAVAQGIYDVTLGPAAPVSAWRFIQDVFITPAGWAMIGLGLLAGALFSVGVLGDQRGVVSAAAGPAGRAGHRDRDLADGGAAQPGAARDLGPGGGGRAIRGRAAVSHRAGRSAAGVGPLHLALIPAGRPAAGGADVKPRGSRGNAMYRPLRWRGSKYTVFSEGR